MFRQMWRRTAARVSLNVGWRFRYHAAVRTAPRALGLSRVASKVTRENSPSRQGVVRAMASRTTGAAFPRPGAPGWLLSGSGVLVRVRNQGRHKGAEQCPAAPARIVHKLEEAEIERQLVLRQAAVWP